MLSEWKHANKTAQQREEKPDRAEPRGSCERRWGRAAEGARLRRRGAGVAERARRGGLTRRSGRAGRGAAAQPGGRADKGAGGRRGARGAAWCGDNAATATAPGGGCRAHKAGAEAGAGRSRAVGGVAGGQRRGRGEKVGRPASPAAPGHGNGTGRGGARPPAWEDWGGVHGPAAAALPRRGLGAGKDRAVASSPPQARRLRRDGLRLQVLRPGGRRGPVNAP